MDTGEQGQVPRDNSENYNLFPIKDNDNIFLDLIDSLFDELLDNMEYDKEDNLLNLFIDKIYPKKLFKKIFYNYYMNKLYPLRPIILDYVNIYNKSNYVDSPAGHSTNNNEDSIQILKKRKE